ncbi:MAG: penicillin-binding protein 1A [Alphaproteobacteria bacterium]
MSRFSKAIGSLFGWILSIGFTMVILGGIAGFLLFEHYNSDLPDYSQLSVYEPPNISRLYTADGKLLAEYATQKRVFVPLKAIPKVVINAFISAEDKNYYQHTGIDITGIARAMRDNIINYGRGKSLVGGSTITQQVVKNFLLSSEKSLERKAKEAILAVRINTVFSKDKIMELYLNEIYLGMGSYGVASAALNYFNKPLEEITIEEAALLAAQPKAPSLYSPVHHHARALERRNWVIDRMAADGHVTAQEAEDAKKTPITLVDREEDEVVSAEFFAEEVRRQLVDRYGSDVLYKGGLVVKTTIQPELQKAADKALRQTLIDYDRRRGFRGPFGHFKSMDDWKEQLKKLREEKAALLMDGQQLAVVMAMDATRARIAFADGSIGYLHQPLLKWTRRVISDGVLGPEVNKPADILKKQDVVLVGPVDEEQKKLIKSAWHKEAWDLQQVPEVNGGLVVIDPHSGRVLAMSGGYAYGKTQFNRVTQAKRQPGSAFKPFVYMAALENGFTPSTILSDSPVEIYDPKSGNTWRPQNYGGEYMGDITMRVGLEKSRNTVTVQLARMVGLDKVIDMAKRLNIYPSAPEYLSIVLGSEETTLIRLTNAYGMIVNGGKAISPSLIERIDDRHGKTIFRRDNRECLDCQPKSLGDINLVSPPPVPPDDREQVVDERIAYQMVSMLRGVVERGTGVRAKQLEKIVAGKTGTTNDSKDTWFIGFSPDLVTGVYIGYDNPRTLGRKETGSSVALPAFISFMETALADAQNKPFRIPPGLMLMKVDRKTGIPLYGYDGSDAEVITEAFITGRPLYLPGVSSSQEWSIHEDNTVGSYSDPGHGQDAYSPPVRLPPPIPRGHAHPEEAPATGTGGLY